MIDNKYKLDCSFKINAWVLNTVSYISITSIAKVCLVKALVGQ